MNARHLIILFIHEPLIFLFTYVIFTLFIYTLIHLFTYLVQMYSRSLQNPRIQSIQKKGFILKNFLFGERRDTNR